LERDCCIVKSVTIRAPSARRFTPTSIKRYAQLRDRKPQLTRDAKQQALRVTPFRSSVLQEIAAPSGVVRSHWPLGYGAALRSSRAWKRLDRRKMPNRSPSSLKTEGDAASTIRCR
jgi:hypothetical protein